MPCTQHCPAQLTLFYSLPKCSRNFVIIRGTALCLSSGAGFAQRQTVRCNASSVANNSRAKGLLYQHQRWTNGRVQPTPLWFSFGINKERRSKCKRYIKIIFIFLKKICSLNFGSFKFSVNLRQGVIPIRGHDHHKWSGQPPNVRATYERYANPETA